jgi:predicted DNA-binding protein (MmcQ/YjbR family)
MTLEEIQAICSQLPAVTQDIKWEDHLCFNVGGKMFLITSPDTFPVTASFKTSDENFELLSARPGFKPAPYLARNKWIYTEDIRLMNEAEWKRYIEEAHMIVASKLPKKFQKEHGIG